MLARGWRRLYGDPASGLRTTLPMVWVRAWGLAPGERCEVVYDEIIVLIPEKARGGAQAERVLRAMTGEK